MNKEYHKIHSLYKRDENKKIILGDYAKPIFKFLENCQWDFTEKVNGMNICIKWENHKLKFGNEGSDIPDLINEYYLSMILKTYKLKRFEKAFNDKTVEMYFEGYGKGIQETDGSRYIPDGNSLILFDIRINGYWLERKNMLDIASIFELNVVPYLGHGTLMDLNEIVRRGFKSIVGNHNLVAEGIVAKPPVELLTKTGQRIITKLKYLDFPVESRGNGGTIITKKRLNY